MAGAYQNALDDPELMSLRDEIALTDARVCDLLEQLATAETRELWREIFEAVEQGRKLRDSERKRLVVMQQFISAEQAMLFAGAVVESVRKHIRDPDVLRAVANDIAALTGSRERTHDD